jgi:hypothetical protein
VPAFTKPRTNVKRQSYDRVNPVHRTSRPAGSFACFRLGSPEFKSGLALKLCGLYSTLSIVRAGRVPRMGDMTNAYKILGGKPEMSSLQRPLGRPRIKRNDNIKVDLLMKTI